MLPSVEFICLRVAYREVFWEELSRLIWYYRSIRRPLLFWVLVIIFHSLPSSVGCSFQCKLFSIFKLLCLVFVRYYLSSRTALENYVLFVTALRSSWENFFADTRFALFSVDCEGELSIRFRKHSPSLPGLVSVIGLYCYHVNMYFYGCVVILSSCKCSPTAELKPGQRESQIDARWILGSTCGSI